MAQYTPQDTIQYSMFIKRAIIESLQAAFANHPTKMVREANVAVDMNTARLKFPAIIVKFYEREITNIGVGHVEYLPSSQDPDPSNPTEFIKYYHRLYRGDVSFEVYGMSSVDRDVLRDALIEVLAMTDTTPGGQGFLDRFYNKFDTPYGQWHFPVLNLDKITGYGEQQQLAPWLPEDTFVYQASYRVPILGEVYSITPVLPSSTGLLEEVDVYPWIEDIDPPPADADADDYYRFTGWPEDETNI